MKHGRPILLVENDAVDVETVRRALDQIEVSNQLLVAHEGTEAIDLLSGRSPIRPSLILLDLNMPGMGGLEVLSALRRRKLASGIPVILLTTSRRREDLEQAFDLHAAGYVVKPVDYPEFVEALRTIASYWTLSELPE